MKPGDLVMVRNDTPLNTSPWLYGGEDLPWDENNTFIPTDVPVFSGDIGTILKIVKDPIILDNREYLKILTPRGIGWVWSGYVEILS